MKIKNTARWSCIKICLNPFSFQVVNPEIFSTHFSAIFCVKNLGILREIPLVSLFRIKI